MDRLQMLSEVLSQDPNNAFARYGLAMEYSGRGELDRAIEEFQKLLVVHPDYVAGYFMAAQSLAKANRVADAKGMLREGIRAAEKTKDSHALSEMQGMLADLE
jgi:cytochrome c-type biogenesis protein CcmH/NrfG